ncbi:hypothetical protein FQR65_LT14653 [Abscondita terminalis]|nr:hypothetical protein FQR65_LT14653 [Abscondita terminalis]
MKTSTFPFPTITRALEDLRQGKMIVLFDHENRENEGDLVLAAEMVTPEAINFMAQYARGLICLALVEEDIKRLQIPMMVKQSTNPFNTAFTVSIEAAKGVTTGISAADRAHTIQVAVNPQSGPQDIVMPGHIFPLRAQKVLQPWSSGYCHARTYFSITCPKGVTTGISAADRAHTIQVAVNPQSGPQDIVMPGHIFPLRAQKVLQPVFPPQTELIPYKLLLTHKVVLRILSCPDIFFHYVPKRCYNRYFRRRPSSYHKVDASLVQDATLYVTLQPCCHTEKKTLPCTDLIIKSGILKVVYGFRDPNPAVNSCADKVLQDAGIECIHHPLALIDNFYVSYAFWWKYKRPFTTAKLAMSLDGKIAGENGKRIQLTGDIAQQFTHQQRKHSDAILTTAKTIALDNPLLNCRINGNIYKKPLYILDTHLNTSISANIFKSAEPITIFHNVEVNKKEQNRFQKYDIRFFPIKSNTHGLDLLEILKQIGQDGIIDLWIEAGGKSFQSFVQNNLLQHAFIHVAPRWLGGNTQSAFTSSEPLKGALLTGSIILGEDTCFEFKWGEH